jgi:DNA-binding SARP family transcriptional activator
VNRDELDEEANGLLLRVYAAAKDRQSLLRHYAGFTELLHEELGVAPAGEIVGLYERLLSGLD